MKKKHAALYIRVSTDQQFEEGYSVDAQKDMLEGGSAQNVTKLRAMGIDVENYDFSEGNADGYEVEWYD